MLPTTAIIFTILICLFSCNLHIEASSPSSLFAPCQNDWCWLPDVYGEYEIRIPSSTPVTYTAASSLCATYGASIAAVTDRAIDALSRRNLPALSVAWSSAFYNMTGGMSFQSSLLGKEPGLLLNTTRFASLSNADNWFDATNDDVFFIPRSGFDSPGCFVFNATETWNITSSFSPSCSSSTSLAIPVCERKTSIQWTPLNDTFLEIGLSSFVATQSQADAICQARGGNLALFPAGATGIDSNKSYVVDIIGGTSARPSGTASEDFWVGFNPVSGSWVSRTEAINETIDLLTTGLPTSSTETCSYFNWTTKTLFSSSCLASVNRTFACTRYSRPEMRNVSSEWCVDSNLDRAYILLPLSYGLDETKKRTFMNATAIQDKCTQEFGGQLTMTNFDHPSSISWCYGSHGNSSVAALNTYYDPATKLLISGSAATDYPYFITDQVSDNASSRAWVGNLTVAQGTNSTSLALPGICVTNLSASQSIRFLTVPWSPSRFMAVAGGQVNVSIMPSRPLYKSANESYKVCWTTSSDLTIPSGYSDACVHFNGSIRDEVKSFVMSVSPSIDTNNKQIQVIFQCNPSTDCGSQTFNIQYLHSVAALKFSARKIDPSLVTQAESFDSNLPLNKTNSTLWAGIPYYFEIKSDSFPYLSASEYDNLAFEFSSEVPECSVNYYDSFPSSPINTAAKNVLWFKSQSQKFVLNCPKPLPSSSAFSVYVRCDANVGLYSMEASTNSYTSSASSAYPHTSMLCRNFPNKTTVLNFDLGVVAAATNLNWSITHADLGSAFSEDGGATYIFKYYPFKIKLNTFTVTLDYPNISTQLEATDFNRAPFVCVRLVISLQTWIGDVACYRFRQDTISQDYFDDTTNTTKRGQVKFNFTLDPNRNFPSSGNMTSYFELFGSEVQLQYGNTTAIRQKNYKLTPYKIKIAVSGLSDVLVYDASNPATLTIVGTNEYNVTCANPVASCDNCQNGFDAASFLFLSTSYTVNNFPQSGSVAATLDWRAGASQITQTVVFSPVFQCSSVENFWVFDFKFNASIEMRKPEKLNLSNVPATIYQGGSPRTFYIFTPNPFVAYGSIQNPLVNMSISTASSAIRVLPKNATWNTSSTYFPIQIFGDAAAASQRIDFTILSPTTPQFTAPSSIYVQVLPRATIELRLNNPQTAYVVDATYSVGVTISRLPITTTESLIVSLVQNSSFFTATNVTFVWSNGTTTGTIYFKFTSLPSLSKSLSASEYGWLNLSTMGTSGDAYYSPSPLVSSIKLGPIRYQIAVNVNCPAFSLAGSTFDVLVSLSRPPITSVLVRLTVVTNSTGAVSLAYSPVILIWYAGDSTTKSFNVTSNITFEGDATLNFTVDSSGSIVSEVSTTINATGSPALSQDPNAISFAIRARSPVRSSLFGFHDIIVDRKTCFNITIARPPPTLGTLFVSLAGPGVSYVRIVPAKVTFYSYSPTTQILCINGSSVTPSRVNLTLSLSGDAVNLFVPYDSESVIQLVVNPKLKLITDLPPVLIVGGINGRNSSFALPEPLAPDVVFILTFSAPGVTFNPATFVIWGSEPNTNATRYFVMQTASQDMNVTLTAKIEGNATGFAPISQNLELLALGTVVVTADADPIFRDEIAFLTITLSRAPLEKSLLLATVDTNCSTPLLDWCIMSQNSFVFSGTTATTVAVVIRLKSGVVDIPFNQQIPFIVVFNISSSAVPQYSLFGRYPTAVTFVKRRTITVLNPFTTVFLGYPQLLLFNISVLPDEASIVYLRTSITNDTNGFVAWNSTAAPVSQWIRQMSITVFDKPDPATNGTISLRFLLTSTPPVEQLRYVPPDPIVIKVVEKVRIMLMTQINPTQILGQGNNQSFIVSLNRPPSGWLKAKFIFDAVFGNMIRFEPAELYWDGSVDTALTLNRTCLVIGEYLGDAESIAFRVESSSMEEVVVVTNGNGAGTNVTAPIISSLTVEGLRRVSFYANNNTNLVAQSGVQRFIYVEVTALPVKYPLTLQLTYNGLPGSLQCNTSFIRFDASGISNSASSTINSGGSTTTSLAPAPKQSTSKIQAINCTALSPSSNAEFNVTIVEGPEYSKQVDGFVSFAILRPPELLVRLPNDQFANLSESITVPSETNVSFTLEIQSFEGAQSDSVSVSSQLDTGNTQEFAVAQPTGSLIFTAANLRQTVSAAFVLRIANTFNVTLHFDFTSKKYVFSIIVVPSINVVIPQFPKSIVAGPWNGLEFAVNQTLIPTDSRVIELRFDLSGCPSSSATITSDALRWSRTIYGTIIVNVIGVSARTVCSLVVRPVTSLAPASQMPSYFSGSFVILAQPAVKVGINASEPSAAQRTQALSVPFKALQKEGQSIEIHVNFGEFRFTSVSGRTSFTNTSSSSSSANNNTNYNSNITSSGFDLPFVFMTKPASPDAAVTGLPVNIPNSLEMGNVPVYVIADKTIEQAPRGLTAGFTATCPNLIRVVPSRQTPNRILPDGNISNVGATIIITPCSQLLLIDAETLTIVFGSRAFVNYVHPEPNGTAVVLTFGRVSADLLSAADWGSVQGPAVAGTLIGAFWFPALSLQPWRIASAVLSMDCPVTPVRYLEKQTDLPKVYFFFEGEVKVAPLEENGQWLAVAFVNTGFVVACFATHLVVAVAVYFRASGKVKRTFAEVCAIVHFPSASFHFVFFFAGSIIESSFRVIFLNAKVALTTAGIVLLVSPLVVVTVILHGVVWRNHSLKYHDVSHLLKQKLSFMRIVGKSGFWTHPNMSYVYRHASFFQPFRGPFRWFLLFEYGFTVLLALLSAIEPTGLAGCQARSTGIAAVYYLLMGAILFWRPYTVLLHNFSFALYYFVMAACTTTIAAQMGDRIRSDSIEQSAISLAKAASAFQIISAIVVLIMELVSWVFGDEESNKQLEIAAKMVEEQELGIVAGAGYGNGDVDEEMSISGVDQERLLMANGNPLGHDDNDERAERLLDERRNKMKGKHRLPTLHSSSTRGDDANNNYDGRDELMDEVGAGLALEEYLSQVEQQHAKGLFLSGSNAVKGHEEAYSPMKKKDLDAHRNVLRARVNPDYVKPVFNDDQADANNGASSTALSNARARNNHNEFGFGSNVTDVVLGSKRTTYYDGTPDRPWFSAVDNSDMDESPEEAATRQAYAASYDQSRLALGNGDDAKIGRRSDCRFGNKEITPAEFDNM